MKTKILNLTQHPATSEQVAAGVIEPKEEDKARIKQLLTFEQIPTSKEIKNRAKQITSIAQKYNVSKAMIGGAPYFMSALEKALITKGIKPVYAFSKRIVKEEQQEDGTVIKKSIFKFEGFVEPSN